MSKKYTLITGACGGLGRAFVAECARNQENLILVGTNQKKLDALLGDFKDEFKEIEVRTFVCNLASQENRNALVYYINENAFEISKLINNAGVIIEGDLLKTDDEKILNAIEVNCVGTLDLTQKIIKSRKNNEKLEILTVSSMASGYPIPHMAVYAATKAFLTSMMTALSVELKDKNVVISTVCPSGMATTEEMKKSIESMGFSGKLTTLPVERVAKVALKGLKRKKKVVIPGGFNKLVAFFSKPFTCSYLAKTTGKIWKKSQSKRGL